MGMVEQDGKIFVGKSAKPEYLTLKLANRHGLISGATGTGKTVTLQVLAEGFSRAGPYGAGNPEPMLALPAHSIAYAEPVGENHIRVRFKSGDGKFVNAIAFRAVGTPLGKALIDNRGRAVHAAGNIAIDRWQGEERVQLRLADLALT